MDRLLRRLRGALGIGAFAAIGLHAIGWLIVGANALIAGTWPSLADIARMSLFTIPVGGAVGFFAAGAIAVGAGSSRFITKGRAFAAGLPIGFLGGLLLNVSAGGLPVATIVLNSVNVGVITGLLGASAVAIADRADDRGELEDYEPRDQISEAVNDL
jgi:hypothetical protein